MTLPSLDPLALASEARDAADLESRVLDHFAREVGFDVAFTGLAGRTPTLRGLDPEAMRAAFVPGSIYEEELLPLKRAALSRRNVAVDTDVFGTPRVRRTRYYADLVAPLGGRHTLMGYFVLRGVPLGGVMLGRMGSAFTSSEVARVEAALPAITLARVSFGPPPFVSTPLSVVVGIRRWLGRPLATRTDAEQEIVVRDRRGVREMIAKDRQTGEEMVWSRASIQDPSRSGWPYVDLFHVAASLARRRERVLFLGCGGGVAPRQFAQAYPGIAIDVVDCDPGVIELARTHFDLDTIPSLSTHAADASAFIEHAAAGTWDVVVVDVFDAGRLAVGTSSRSFFRHLHRALRPGGAFAFNVVGALDGGEPIRTVLSSARDHFDDVRVVPVMVPDEAFDRAATRNVVLVARRDG